MSLLSLLVLILIFAVLGLALMVYFLIRTFEKTCASDEELVEMFWNAKQEILLKLDEIVKKMIIRKVTRSMK